MKIIHKKAFSVSFPATHRKINTQKLLRDVHAKNKKFDENAKIINDICVPLRKENKNFHDDMKKVHYVKANQYNNETNVLFKKIERQYKERGYKIPSLSFGEDTVFKQSPLLISKSSINKYYSDNPPVKTEEGNDIYQNDKHYNYMKKVNLIAKCKINKIKNPNEIIKIFKRNEPDKIIQKKKINYSVENEKLQSEINELKSQNSKISLNTTGSFYKPPTRHLSCHKINRNKKPVIIRLNIVSKIEPKRKRLLSENTSSLLKSVIEDRKQSENNSKSNEVISTFYSTKNAFLKPSTEISPIKKVQKRKTRMKIKTEKIVKKKPYILTYNKEEDLTNLYNELKDMNGVNNEDINVNLQKYFEMYSDNDKEEKGIINLKKKSPFNSYLRSHLLGMKIKNVNLYSKIKESFSHLKEQKNKSHHDIMKQMKKADKKINALNMKYTKSFINWYSF